jgi:predicted dehydrogenase
VSDPVRFALLGYGTGGRWFHAPLLASSDAIDLVTVVTTSPERAALARNDHPGIRICASLDELPDAGIEAVAISTPAATHSPLTNRALEAGMHVVCDKPFSLAADAARRSVDTAERCGRLLSPFQNRRWDSDFLTLQRLVAEGRLGPVRRFESRFERFAPERGPGPSGGGTMLDFMTHLVDQALVLLGPVTHVYAEWTMRDSGLDDDVFVALTHESGARSHLSGGWSQRQPGPRFRVTGEHATFVLETPMDGQEAALRSGTTPASAGSAWGVEPESAWGHLHCDDGDEIVPTARGRWDSFYEQFAAAVRSGSPVPVLPADAVATATVLDAARVSATGCRSVALP